MFRVIIVLYLLLTVAHCWAQEPQDYAVQLSALVEDDPAMISLHWVQDPNTNYYDIFKKRKGDTGWGRPVVKLPGMASLWQDRYVVEGQAYEYKVVRKAKGYEGYGYISSGIELPAQEYRGKLILLVEKTHSLQLAAELERYRLDLEGDGWQVTRHDVSWGMAVKDVKELMVSEYKAAPDQVKAVFLLGHVPVPYSGKIMPDGHVDHHGAWPADGYYGDMDGVWTDQHVNTTKPADDRNDNVPGDGKFDQNQFPSDIELYVGRVDFTNMDIFDERETELLRAYLDRNHAFRQGQLKVKEKGLIDDNFGDFDGEAFSVNAWRNFAPLVGCGNTDDKDYLRSLKHKSYLWSFGCGGGYYSSCKGIGTTRDFARNKLQSVFSLLFGSYFGDWDSDNNLLRASLASGNTLASIWAGRPHWMLHDMAMGETLGYCTRLTQNNATTYEYNYGARLVSISLLGDPTLRMNYITPPTSLATSQLEDNVLLNWAASDADCLVGYHIYRRDDSQQPFYRVNKNPVNQLAYIDSCVVAGEYTYMVRAVALETSASGSYFNLSQGLQNDITVTGGPQVVARFDLFQKGDSIYFRNESANATAYYWEFGDGSYSLIKEPVHLYKKEGDFKVSLVAYNDCSVDSFCLTLLSTPTKLKASLDGLHTYLTWNAPDHERVKGYNIYRVNHPTRAYLQLNHELCTNTTFIDSCRSAGNYVYKVSAVYDNSLGDVHQESRGVEVPIRIERSIGVDAEFTIEQYGDTIKIINHSINAWEYEWDFGDGFSSNGKDPLYIYRQPGKYAIVLTAYNGCDSRVFSAPVQLLETDI